VFFVDIEGHQEDLMVSQALTEIRERAGFLKVLGSYPMAVS
jgi:chorismate mutase/prephenate dehydratase